MLRLTAFLALAGLISGTTAQNPDRQNPGVKPGQKAPAFKLDLLQEGKQFDLAASLATGPVVLVFGSYT
jgi:hypothetical protein